MAKFIENISSKEIPRLYRIFEDEVPFDVLELKDRVKHEITKEEQKDLDEYEIDLKIRSLK